MQWSSIKRSLYQGNVSTEIYRLIEPELIKGNLENLQRFSIWSTIAFIGMILMSFFEPSLEKNRIVYMTTAAADILALCLALGPCRKNASLIQPCVYFFLTDMLCFGILLCTVVEPNEVAVSFVILLFALPLLFTDRPIHMVIFITFGLIAYTVIEDYTVTNLVNTERALQIQRYNATNVYPYGILSMVVSSYMMRIKIERYAYIEKNRMLSETDQMTGLLNRRSYSIQLEKLKKEEPDPSLIICSIDLNGLKATNDTSGHSAGDELICAAAACIKDVLEPYGSCYRTGGDEFIAIVHSEKSCDELKEALRKRCSIWHGGIVNTSSLSVGIIKNDEALDIDSLISKADAEMYADKAKYYAEVGHNRRRNSRLTF